MNKCKKCGNVIVDWVDSEGKHWHPFFVGYCPDCDVPLPSCEVEKCSCEV